MSKLDVADIIALQFDDAIIARDGEKLNKLIDEAIETAESETELSQAIIYYSLGTAYGTIESIYGTNDDILKKQLYYLRKCIIALESLNYDTAQKKLQIETYKTNAYVNYANVLSRCGRIIAAIAYYKTALSLHPTFGMAMGNLGKIYMDYGVLEFDPGHQQYFHHYAYSYLMSSTKCTDPNTYPDAIAFFQVQAAKYTDEYIKSFLSKPLKIKEIKIRNKSELAYRQWAVENHLFLNTMNDLPPKELCFACDVLQLPGMVTSINTKPIFHGMFNQIKQEYVFARYQYYSTLQYHEKPHFADKDTHLVNFADYPQYGIRVEKLKSAYKTLFSLLDKMAYFINAYFDLGIKERDVSFSSIWKSEHRVGKNNYQYKNTLNPTANFALRSLYWISKDLYESFENSPNPQLERIKNVRHALEHKYVKVTRGWFAERETGEIDDLALYVDEDELYDLTLQLMRIVREAIICLALCVHVEENQRQEKNSEKIVVPIFLDEYDDTWKT